MNLGSFLFGLSAILCLSGAAVVVSAKNPIRGALGLLATIVGIAALSLYLSAPFLAATQLLVGAGAIVILFVFVAMMLGPSATLPEQSSKGPPLSRFIAGGLAGVFGIAVLGLLGGADFHELQETTSTYGTLEEFGGLLFSEGVAPFELTAVLLLVAVVGAIAVARERTDTTKDESTDEHVAKEGTAQ